MTNIFRSDAPFEATKIGGGFFVTIDGEVVDVTRRTKRATLAEVAKWDARRADYRADRRARVDAYLADRAARTPAPVVEDAQLALF